MEKFDGFEYTKKDLIGHGAFAIVYKGRYTDVSYPLLFHVFFSNHTKIGFITVVLSNHYY